MDGLEKIATELRDASAELAQSNDAHTAVEEQRFEELLKKYVLSDPRFRFGGVCNLLATIAGICEEQSKLEGDDWEKAAQAIDQCSESCDLPYAQPEYTALDAAADAVDRAYAKSRDEALA